MRVFFCLLLFSTFLFSCSKKDEKTGSEVSYVNAKRLLDRHDYNEAAEAFDKIDDEFPFSKWGTKGKVMALYARYKNEEYDKAIQLADDFIASYPNSEYAPYMFYMKGLVYYNQIPSIERAQDDTKKTSDVFRELIARFPADDHAIDAEEKLKFVDEHLAGVKMAVGRSQIFNNNYVGAIGNFYDVLRFYRFSDQVPEAYFRIAESYYKIGLDREGLDVVAEMKKKFPQNIWTQLALKIVENAR